MLLINYHYCFSSGDLTRFSELTYRFGWEKNWRIHFHNSSVNRQQRGHEGSRTSSWVLSVTASHTAWHILDLRYNWIYSYHGFIFQHKTSLCEKKFYGVAINFLKIVSCQILRVDWSSKGKLSVWLVRIKGRTATEDSNLISQWTFVYLRFWVVSPEINGSIVEIVGIFCLPLVNSGAFVSIPDMDFQIVSFSCMVTTAFKRTGKGSLKIIFSFMFQAVSVAIYFPPKLLVATRKWTFKGSFFLMHCTDMSIKMKAFVSLVFALVACM